MKPRLFPVFAASSLKKNCRVAFPAAAMAAVVTFAASPFAGALTVIWDGGVGGTAVDLGTAANWTGDTLPSVVTPDIAEWNGTVAGPLSLIHSNNAFAGAPGNGGISLNITAAQTGAVTIDSGTNVSALRMNNLTVEAGAGAFTLGDTLNAFGLTLGGVPGTHTWTNSSSNPVTISSDITWGLGGQGAHILAVGGTGNWNFNNPIGQGNGTLTFTKSGTGIANLNGISPTAAAISVENGTLNLTGTYTATATNLISAGTIASQNGILNINGGTLNANKNTIPSIAIGAVAGSRGFLNVTSGTVGTANEFHVGRGNGAYASLNVSGGTVTSASWLCVGLNNDRAVLNQSGGSLTVTANRMTIGAGGAGSIGVANLSGGTFTNSVGVFVGENGTGTLNISGTANATIGDLKFANNATSLAGTVNLLGGTLSVGGITKGPSTATGVYEMNFNGGTLKATANNANFFADLANTGAFVRSGGANIDTNGFNVTITEALLAPTGNGVTAPTVTTGGAGYVDTPVVTIARGGTDTTGVGATAVANISGGVVTSITITNRGSGYTDTPVFTLSGGGATTEAVVTANANTANTGGGLTKTGAGNLTLDSDNTYSGPTLVSAGTLTLGNTGTITNSSSITVNGATSKLVKASGSDLSRPVTLTQGALDGVGIINAITVANLTQNTLDAGNGANGILTVNNLTFQGAATVNVTHTGTNVTRGFYADNLTTSGAGKVVINASNTNGVWQAGDYEVIQYGTSFTGLASHFQVGTIAGLTAQQTATINVSGSGIFLRIVGDSLTWTGRQNSNWGTTPVGGSFNWNYPTNNQNSEFANGNPVLFNDNATRVTVNLTSNVSPSTTIFDNSTKDYILSSTGAFGIAGGGSLIKNGEGMVTILTNNTYTGSTTINAGTLQLGNGTTDGSIATSGLITANGGSLIFNLAGSHTYANPIAGNASATIYKRGAGSLTLAGNNTFAGDLVLENGVLNLNSPTALGAAPGFLTIQGGSINNTSGAAVVSTSNKPQKWEADFTFTGTHDLALGTGAVTLGGGGTSRTITVSNGNLGTGPIASAAQNLVKTGAGALRLSGGASVIQGTVDIQAGTISSSEDFSANGLFGTGIFENGSANTKWSFWTIATDQTSNVLIRNGGGTGLLGIVKRGAGTWTLTNNANNATANLAVNIGKLVLDNTGTYGCIPSATNLNCIIGNNAAANGVLEINGATVTYNNTDNADLIAYRNTLSIANNATGAGAVHMSSGSLSTFRQLSIGSIGGAYGDYSQSGGSASVGGFLAIGLGTATGSFNQTGGTFTMTTSPVTNAAGTGSNGVMNLGGSAVFNVNGTADNGIWVGENGTATLNVSGNAAINFAATNNGIQLGRNAASIGTVNLNGGTVTLPRIYKGAGAGTLNFNGGVLAANAASATFLTGLTNAYVHSGGGTVNNGGNAITIGQALLAPAGNGLSASGLSVAGTGFIGTPVVQITGDGTGASAVANVNSSGVLTGITITNPGTGYITPPAFTLLGGGIGSVGGVEGSASLVPNTSGGMTFSGAGVTTLTAVNTYTGNSTVSTGTTLALADNAVLRFVPGANGTTNKVTGAGNAFFYGDFNIELGGAAIASGNSWTLVDVTSRTFDPLLFNIPGFTQASDVWTKVDGNNTWTFTEATGVLKLQVTGLGGYAGWAAANAGGGPSTGDFDNDGVRNGVEYFMGATGSSFTANPGLVNGKVTWPKDPAYSGTYTVQTSPNLSVWTDVASTVVGNTVEYTPATGGGKVFVRLVVNPN